MLKDPPVAEPPPPMAGMASASQSRLVSTSANRKVTQTAFLGQIWTWFNRLCSTGHGFSLGSVECLTPTWICA